MRVAHRDRGARRHAPGAADDHLRSQDRSSVRIDPETPVRGNVGALGRGGKRRPCRLAKRHHPGAHFANLLFACLLECHSFPARRSKYSERKRRQVQRAVVQIAKIEVGTLFGHLRDAAAELLAWSGDKCLDPGATIRNRRSIDLVHIPECHPVLVRQLHHQIIGQQCSLLLDLSEAIEHLLVVAFARNDRGELVVLVDGHVLVSAPHDLGEGHGLAGGDSDGGVQSRSQNQDGKAKQRGVQQGKPPTSAAPGPIVPSIGPQPHPTWRTAAGQTRPVDHQAVQTKRPVRRGRTGR